MEFEVSDSAVKPQKENRIVNEKALSLQAVAERLDISDETARREIEAGKLKAYRIGRQWRVFEADFLDYLARHASQWVERAV